MKNKLRTREYMTLRRQVLKCTDASQLIGMKQFVLSYYDAKKQDHGELLALYLERESDLNPEILESEIENIIHSRLVKN